MGNSIETIKAMAEEMMTQARSLVAEKAMEIWADLETERVRDNQVPPFGELKVRIDYTLALGARVSVGSKVSWETRVKRGGQCDTVVIDPDQPELPGMPGKGDGEELGRKEAQEAQEGQQGEKPEDVEEPGREEEQELRPTQEHRLALPKKMKTSACIRIMDCGRDGWDGSWSIMSPTGGVTRHVEQRWATHGCAFANAKAEMKKWALENAPTLVPHLIDWEMEQN